LILYTSDKGVNWDYPMIPPYGYFRSIDFVSETTGWIVGVGGVILKTTNGGVTFIEDEIYASQPEGFYLSQNYPNPFNPITNIKFTIPQSPLPGGDGRGGLVTLKVYDVLGNAIATLVNEVISVGEYEVEFNSQSGFVRNLPSGIYFYQLRAGDYIETKKMVLLK